MTINDVLALARAGFSAQQIAALAQPAPAAPVPAAPAPAPAAPAPAPAPAAPAPDPNGAKLDTLIALFQQQQLQQPQPQMPDADAILAEIIAPQPPKTENK